MGFNAAQAVSALDYDFSAVGGPAGTTPEPSADQVRTMQFRLRTLFGLDDTDPTAINDRLRSMSEDEIRERDGELIDIYADACSQQPSADDLRALPHRVLQAYIGWLSGELNTPTAGSGPTRRSPAPLKSV